MNSWYSIDNAAKGKPRIDIFDEIGLFGVTAKDFIADLRELEGTAAEADLYLNTPGGAVFEGFAIYSAIKESKLAVDVVIYNAWSIGSVIAMAGRSVTIAENGYFMIHNPRALSYGEERDMKKTITLLGKVKETIISAYAARTGKDREDIAQLMDDETWFDGAEAVNNGFADKTIAPMKIAASFDVSKFGYTPPPIVTAIGGLHSNSAHAEPNSKEALKMPNEIVSAQEPTKPQPANYADIKACCPGAPAEFICAQLERNVTLDQAQSNWMEHQNKLIAESRAAVEEAEKKLAAKAQADAAGVPVLGSGTPKPQEQSGDPLTEWPDLVASFEKKGYSKQRALSAANQQNPELREAYVAAFNKENPHKR